MTFFSRYTNEDGEKVHGNTTYLFERYAYIQKTKLFYNLILDENGNIYWLKFSENDLKMTTALSKPALPGNFFWLTQVKLSQVFILVNFFNAIKLVRVYF